jgi:hypothetical protein
MYLGRKLIDVDPARQRNPQYSRYQAEHQQGLRIVGMPWFKEQQSEALKVSSEVRSTSVSF